MFNFFSLKSRISEKMPMPKSPTRKIKPSPPRSKEREMSNFRDNQNERDCDRISDSETSDLEFSDFDKNDFYNTSSRRPVSGGGREDLLTSDTKRSSSDARGRAINKRVALDAQKEGFDPDQKRIAYVKPKRLGTNLPPSAAPQVLPSSSRGAAAEDAFRGRSGVSDKKHRMNIGAPQAPSPRSRQEDVANNSSYFSSQKREHLLDEDDDVAAFGDEPSSAAAYGRAPSGVGSSKYPDLINKMLALCYNEKDFIKDTCAGRLRTQYQKVFSSYKDKMTSRDRAIVSSGIDYIYNFSRINSIPKENAEWLISIHEIPISHIVSYTSKDVLKTIAKQYNLPCSNKKAEEIVANLREVLEKN